MNVTGGAADVTTYFMLRTAADGTATVGAAIANIDLQYIRTGDSPSAKADAVELGAINGAHEANKAKEVDGVDAPGLYRVDWPDAAFVAGVPQVILSVKLANSFTEHMAVEIDTPVGAAASVTGAVGSVAAGVDVSTIETVDATDTLDASAQTGAQAALEVNNLDHLAKIATAGADMTAEVVDNSILSRMLANGDTSAFDPVTDGLQPIRDAIAAATPVLYNPDGSSVIVDGNEDAGTWASCSVDDANWWTVSDAAGGLEVVCEFNMGANRVASSILITGYYNRSGGGGFVTEIYAYNYTSTAWDKISVSSLDGEMRSRGTDKDYEYTLGSAYTDRVTTPGEVRIRFLCTRGADGGDVLYLNYLALDGVTEAALTPDLVAEAVSAHDVSMHTSHETLGFRVSLSIIGDYDVTTADTATSFTCASLPAIANYYQFHAVRIHDVTNDRYAGSWIASMDNAGVVILGRALPWTPDTASEMYVRGAVVSPSEIQAAIEAGVLNTVAIDVAGLNGDVMRGTDGVSLVVPDASGTAAALHAITNALEPLGTVMRGTDGVSLVVPDAAGSAAALHAVTDALIAGLNDPTAVEIVTALMATTGITAGGVASYNDILKAIYALARGRISRAGDVYTFYDDDNATVLFTLTIAAAERTIA